MSETTAPEVELTEQDQIDLESLTENVEKHTVLEVWRSILANIEASAAEKVSPQNANRLVGMWPKLAFQDLPRYHEVYHNLLTELRDLLDAVITEGDAPFDNIEDDMEANRALYLELLFVWQERIMQWEHRWDASWSDSHIIIAAIADATAFFVGPQGLVEHLSQSGFAYSDADREALGERLTAAKELL